MNPRSRCLVVLSWALLVNATAAQESPSARGRAGAFLRLGVGARAGSLSDAYVAATSGPTAIHWNPAGLAQNHFWQFEASQRRFDLQRTFSFAGISFPITPRLAAGVGWIGFASEGIEARRGNTTEPDEYFSDSENALLFSASYRLAGWLAIGATTKAIMHSLYNESARGYSASAGAQLFLHHRLTLGAAWQDFYSTFRWKNGRWENFPRTAMLGAAWRINSHSFFTLDYHQTAREAGRWRAGFELSAFSSLPLRVGYRQSSFAAGAGLVMPIAASQVRIDYHFAAHDGINGRAHAFSIAIDFGNKSSSK